MSLAQNIHKCSQILFLHVSCPEHSQMFTNPISTSLAQNIHKCSQSLFLHVSCPEHSQMSTNLISTCRLCRTFTNVHRSYFHMSLAQNIHNVHKSYFYTYEEILDISLFFTLILTFSCCSLSMANTAWR